MLLHLAGDVALDTERALALLADYPPDTLEAYDAGPTTSGPPRSGASSSSSRCRKPSPDRW